MPELAYPLALLLLPLPLLVLRFVRRSRSDGAALVVPEGVARGLLTGSGPAPGAERGRFFYATIMWALLVIALAGPRTLLPVPALQASGRDLAIALDLSGSMVREDFFLDGEEVTRLDAVKRVGADFARRRAGDRVALIVFGSEAYYAAPFSFDTEAVAQRIEEASIGISGRATNIADALGIALKRMRNSPAASRVVILLSDGVNNAGAANPRGVAKLAADLGVRVHTIAFGPKDLSDADEGERGVVDAATLAAMADLSGGESFRVRTTEDLVAVTEALDRLEATAGDGLAAEVFREFWIWPAALVGLFGVLAAWRGAE
ncbi:von Willebrand factor A [Roseivivax halodurans JCM 10272]|uniref:von Willebrand factor A n=1 Tax=Roseivivax halodurans JCM 10272 TaxID=1449350 RepID=X7EE65_9RHOB|nr:VWA domain-containing protein [Roseivivax halodurans]ETX14237.1 von Willebrand factor A [Roseivivax halodurans JCM 10272]